MMNPFLPTAKSTTSPYDRDHLRRVVLERNLIGLANDTKWNELITAVRVRTGLRPRYRCKCIDAKPSYWDGEWFYHLPFPLLSIEWIDIVLCENVVGPHHVRRTSVIDYSSWLLPLLQQIGFDYRVGTTMVRVFGYSPRNLDLFDQDVDRGVRTDVSLR